MLFDVSYRNALYESKQYILQTSLHNMYLLVLLWGLPVRLIVVLVYPLIPHFKLSM